MSKLQTPQPRAYHLYVYSNADPSKCYYCQRPSEALDHVLPQSLAYALPDERWPRELLTIVPCCRQCNSIARDLLFSTLRAKKAFILQRLGELHMRADFSALMSTLANEHVAMQAELGASKRAGAYVSEWCAALSRMWNALMSAE